MCYLRRPKAYLWNDASWHLASFLVYICSFYPIIGIHLLTYFTNTLQNYKMKHSYPIVMKQNFINIDYSVFC